MKGRFIVTAVLLLAPLAVAAQGAEPTELRRFRFGVQGNFADKADFGIGARMHINLDRTLPGFGLMASYDHYFPPNDADLPNLPPGTDPGYWEVNVNAVYTFGGRPTPYVGAGLNLAMASITADLPPLGVIEDSTTDAGLNLLGGVRFRDHFFAEGRIEVRDGGQFVLTAGVLF
jgi:hypothetical protein